VNLKSMLEESAGKFAGNTAIVCGERRLTYKELDEASNRFAHALLKLGIKKGDRVATLLNNTPDSVAVYFGTLKAGSIPVPLDVKYKAEELTSLFDNCRPKALVAEESILEYLRRELPWLRSIEHIISLYGETEGSCLSYGRITAESPSDSVKITVDAEDIALISYMGGPTIDPRGVVLTHRSMVAEVMMASEGFQQTDKDVSMLFSLPMYHMFGLVSVLLTSIYSGSAVVIVPGTGRSITTLLETIEKEKGTIFLGVPYIYALAIRVAEREGLKNDLSSLRIWGSAAAPLTNDIREKFRRYYGTDIIDMWGLTEAVAHVTYHPLDGTSQLDSSGKALPGWQMAVADEEGNLLPPNEKGEVVVSGPIMKSYYDNPQATNQVIKNGWLFTGDVGSIDEGGYLYLSGMNKNMIILKGQNVYPSDIEYVLRDHPKVAQVRVVGVVDELRGEIVKAIIKLKDGENATEQEIRHFCQAHMADYKIPKRVVFTGVELPLGNARMSEEDLLDHITD